VNATAPQDALSQFDGVVSGLVALERLYPRDAIGASFSAGYAQLRPLTALAPAYGSYSTALTARWNHDFDLRWNAQATAGIQQTLTAAGSYPLAVTPTGTLVGRVQGRNTAFSLEASYGAAASPQTGTVALTEQVVLRGSMVAAGAEGPSALARSLRFSLGFMHADPLGGKGAQQAAGTGDAAAAELGVLWGLWRAAQANLRYSAAYQFGQGSGIQPSLVHVLLLGITIRYGTGFMPPSPSLGGRVDGGDAVGIPGTQTPSQQ